MEKTALISFNIVLTLIFLTLFEANTVNIIIMHGVLLLTTLGVLSQLRLTFPFSNHYSDQITLASTIILVIILAGISMS